MLQKKSIKTPFHSREGTKRKRGRPLGGKNKIRRSSGKRYKKRTSETRNKLSIKNELIENTNEEEEEQIDIVDECLAEVKKQPDDDRSETTKSMRRRGRPTKYSPAIKTDSIASRTRGRPRKYSLPSEGEPNQVPKIEKSSSKIDETKSEIESEESPPEDSDDDYDVAQSTIFTRKYVKDNKKKQYRCRFCNFRTYYKNTYASHMERYEDKPGNFQCSLCDEILPLRRKLDHHWRNHMPTYFPDGPENPGFYKCDLCDEKFRKRFQLGRHRTAHKLNCVPEVEPRKVKRCGICGKRFYSEVSLLQHMEQATDEHDPVECDICKKMFRSKRNLTMHLKIHIGPLICHICGSRKYSDASMKVHIRRHNKDYYIHCDVCKKGFYNKSELRLHMISHTSRETNRPFVCQICGRSYRSGCYLKLHVKIAHVEAEEYKRKRYKCDICDFETHLIKCLKIHKQTHTGENLTPCKLCNKLINRRYMVIHIRTHTGEKPFDCSVCGKGFNCKKNLVRHHSRKH